MKKVLFIAIALATVGLIYAFVPKDGATTADSTTAAVPEGEIAWLTWDEAMKANQKAPKKIFIDFYTDWCGWCKKMDASTFKDPGVVKYVNDNFYAVKFNAEQKEAIVFDGKTFEWQAGGRNGVHMLAYSLLDGRLGYPAYVYLTPTMERILISPGYKEAPMLQKELVFVKDDHYSTTSWEQYKASH